MDLLKGEYGADVGLAAAMALIELFALFLGLVTLEEDSRMGTGSIVSSHTVSSSKSEVGNVLGVAVLVLIDVGLGGLMAALEGMAMEVVRMFLKSADAGTERFRTYPRTLVVVVLVVVMVAALSVARTCSPAEPRRLWTVVARGGVALRTTALESRAFRVASDSRHGRDLGEGRRSL
jgi:hypothetical protein